MLATGGDDLIDLVGRVQFQPFNWFTTTLRGRFDEKDFAANRLEISSSFSPFQAFNWFGNNKSLNSVSFSGTYAHIEAQPELGQFYIDVTSKGTEEVLTSRANR